MRFSWKGEKMKVLIRLFLTGLVLWLSSIIGWIDIFGKPLVTAQIWNDLLILAVLSVIIWLGTLLSTLLYKYLLVITLGTMTYFLPIFLGSIGFCLLWIIQQIFPNWIFVSVEFWGELLISLSLVIIWFIRIDDD